MDFSETFMEDGSRPEIDPLTFGVDPVKRQVQELFLSHFETGCFLTFIYSFLR